MIFSINDPVIRERFLKLEVIIFRHLAERVPVFVGDFIHHAESGFDRNRVRFDKERVVEREEPVVQVSRLVDVSLDIEFVEVGHIPRGDVRGHRYETPRAYSEEREIKRVLSGIEQKVPSAQIKYLARLC